MINIGDLLGAYTKIRNPLDDKRVVADVVKNTFGLEIESSQVFFRKNTLILKVNSVQKSFLFIRKDKLLEVIKTSVPDRMVDTISF
jgi:hypothetical protein